MKKMNKKGFTIVELVIVIAVIGILATVLIPTFSDVISSANNSKFTQQARNEYINYCAKDNEAVGGDFIYTDGSKMWVVIEDGNFKTVAEEIKIYDSEAAALEVFKHEITKTVDEVEKTFVVTFTMGDNVEGTKLYKLNSTETEKVANN